MEGDSSSGSRLMMCFGNSNSVVGDGDDVCPMIITMPPPPLPSQHLPFPPPSSSSGASSPPDPPNNATGCFFMETVHHDGAPSSSLTSAVSFSAVKAKIMAHPLYHRLLAAYVDCQKVGAPPEVVEKLDEACASAAILGGGRGCGGEDPGLDQFMEAYCEMLTRYEQELSKPFKDATLFLQRIESQFKTLAFAPRDSSGAYFLTEYTTLML